MTHILVDTANTFFRARHVIRGDASEKIGMAIHITLNSIKKAWNDFDGTHVVFCLEGRSWRKDHYKPYKANRAVARAALTEKEAEEDIRMEKFHTRLGGLEATMDRENVHIFGQLKSLHEKVDNNFKSLMEAIMRHG